MSSVPSRISTVPEYGWSAEGKSSAEISRDIRNTRYKLEGDLRALRERFAPTQVLVSIIASAALAGISYLIRRLRHRKR